MGECTDCGGYTKPKEKLCEECKQKPENQQVVKHSDPCYCWLNKDLCLVHGDRQRRKS